MQERLILAKANGPGSSLSYHRAEFRSTPVTLTARSAAPPAPSPTGEPFTLRSWHPLIPACSACLQNIRPLPRACSVEIPWNCRYQSRQATRHRDR
ncbi:hypothetical protein JZ751_014425 [Albula glossodonta]|uniref:Uncharacterized protein n=1 Tax=Albula glossodonta TaxID=121402 RepID=A0A8T2MXN6_9TELE|nr:hypothetical protein JZ751_014425 [Albula glossodonta]